MIGHRTITSSLRPEEVTILDRLAADLERDNDARQAADRNAPYVPTIRRSTVIRQAIRYVLEHRAEFEAWLVAEAARGLR